MRKTTTMKLYFQFQNDAITYTIDIQPEHVPKHITEETRTAKQIFKEEISKR